MKLEDGRREENAIRERAKRGEPIKGASPAATGDGADVKRRRYTLKKAFAAFFEDKRHTINNEKVIRNWPVTMELYVFPLLGDRDVAEVTTKEVAEVLRPIWHMNMDTAQKVRERLSMLFDWCIAMEHRKSANPAASVKLTLGPQNRPAIHHPALPYARAPELVQRLRAWRGYDSTTLAVEWRLLAATRSADTRLAVWSEIDLEQIPILRNRNFALGS